MIIARRAGCLARAVAQIGRRDRPVDGEAFARPPFGGHRRPRGLQPGARGGDTGQVIGGRAAGAGLDLDDPLVERGVLGGDVAPVRRLQHALVAVGVAGDVGEHMADGPAGQQRGPGDLGVGERRQRGEQFRVRRDGTGDVTANDVHGPSR